MASNLSALSRPERITLAVTLIVIEVGAYCTLGAWLGWRHGGGIFPMTLLMTAISATWAGIVGKTAAVPMLASQAPNSPLVPVANPPLLVSDSRKSTSKTLSQSITAMPLSHGPSTCGWFAIHAGIEIGPLSELEFAKLATGGGIDGSDLVKSPGGTVWTLASEVIPSLRKSRRSAYSEEAMRAEVARLEREKRDLEREVATLEDMLSSEESESDAENEDNPFEDEIAWLEDENAELEEKLKEATHGRLPIGHGVYLPDGWIGTIAGATVVDGKAKYVVKRNDGLVKLVLAASVE